MEIWKQVNGYEGIYEISNTGRVKSLARRKLVKRIGSFMTKERFLKYPLINYPHVTLTNYLGIKKTELIHRLIATAFIPNPENKPEVNHINGNPKDFTLSNLEWVTKSENGKHAFRIGNKKPKKGEDNVLCTITDKSVKEIREKYNTGNYTTRKLGIEYGISCGYVSMIINNKKRCA